MTEARQDWFNNLSLLDQETLNLSEATELQSSICTTQDHLPPPKLVGSDACLRLPSPSPWQQQSTGTKQMTFLSTLASRVTAHSAAAHFSLTSILNPPTPPSNILFVFRAGHFNSFIHSLFIEAHFSFNLIRHIFCLLSVTGACSQHRINLKKSFQMPKIIAQSTIGVYTGNCRNFATVMRKYILSTISEHMHIYTTVPLHCCKHPASYSRHNTVTETRWG